MGRFRVAVEDDEEQEEQYLPSQHVYSSSEDDDSEKHSSKIGTKFYSSPEQTHSNSYDHRTDIYSLAMVIGILFSDYQTAHEETEILSNLKNKKLESFDMDPRLK